MPKAGKKAAAAATAAKPGRPQLPDYLGVENLACCRANQAQRGLAPDQDGKAMKREVHRMYEMKLREAAQQHGWPEAVWAAQKRMWTIEDSVAQRLESTDLVKRYADIKRVCVNVLTPLLAKYYNSSSTTIPTNTTTN